MASCSTKKGRKGQGSLLCARTTTLRVVWRDAPIRKLCADAWEARDTDPRCAALFVNKDNSPPVLDPEGGSETPLASELDTRDPLMGDDSRAASDAMRSSPAAAQSAQGEAQIHNRSISIHVMMDSLVGRAEA